ncbi:FCD domain-containing protein [Marinobacterium sp. OS208]|jgi:DNA-binding GntR family transcriptional regulator|nr:FCD domain-containing protein [Marinobacterium sedimentorum]
MRENRRFHMALIAQCPSRWQLHFISTLYDQSERFRRLSLINLREGPNEVVEHELIMEAAFRRDEEAACELLRAHIEHSNSRVIETVFPQGTVAKEPTGSSTDQPVYPLYKKGLST